MSTAWGYVLAAALSVFVDGGTGVPALAVVAATVGVYKLGWSPPGGG